MEARTTAQKCILALGCTQAILVATLIPEQDFKGVEPLNIETYFTNGWRLPGTLLAAAIAIGTALLVVFNQPRSKPTRALLQCVSEAAFGDLKKLDGNVLAHKVTFFLLRPRRGWWAGAVWRRIFKDKASMKLVPKYRFPPSSRKPRRSFRVDKSDRSLCEGVAGLVFGARMGDFVSTPNLPRLNAHSDEEKLEMFAQKTNDSKDRVKSHAHFDMQSIGGFQVLSPDDSEILGVLMFDSSDPEAVEPIRTKTTIQWHLKALSRVHAS